MISLLCGISKNDTNENLQNRNRLADTENRLVVARGDGVREGWIGSLALTRRMDKQQGSTAEHRELCSIFCDKP